MKATLFKFILFIGNQLSLKHSRSVGRFLGAWVWKLSNKNRHITLTNISKCFPHLSQTEQVSLAKKSVNAAIMNMLELGKLWNTNIGVDAFIDNIYGLDTFKQALAEKKGLLLAAPHMGNWEALNLVLAQFDDFAFLYKPPSDKNIEDLLIKHRGKSRATQIQANARSVRKMLLHLKNQGLLAILPDQRPKGGQGIFATFYGISTYTMSLFSKLAIKTKTPVYFAYALRTEKGFDVYFEKSNDAIYTDLQTSVAYLNQHIQTIVNKAPEQYQWTYKRFSIQPDEGHKFY